MLAAALGTPGAAPAAAMRLIRLLGPGAIRGLLQVLVEEQVRTRRRRIFDLLSALGADVVPEATRWLGDPNWFVVRNMIALLRAVGDRSSLGVIRRPHRATPTCGSGSRRCGACSSSTRPPATSTS